MRKATFLVCLAMACGSSETPGAPDAPIAPADGPGSTNDAAPDTVPDARPADVASADAPPVTLTVLKAGQGTVSSAPAGIACAADCPQASASFLAGTNVMLEAKPAPGSYFQGWAGTTCGTRRFCSVTVADSATVTARFPPVEHNLMFATSAKFDGNLGGLDGGDAKCRTAAEAAGLSGTFVAYLSTETVNARDRLLVPGTTAPARGFIRLDGLPVTDTVDDLAVAHRIWYAVKYDENGEPLDWNVDATWTGSDTSGGSNTNQTCDSFTSAAMGKVGRYGEAAAGPHMWMSSNPAACLLDETYYPSGAARLYCIMVDKTEPQSAPPPVAGKAIYVTKAPFVPGGGIAAANEACRAEKPQGVASVKALLGTMGTAPAGLLDRAASYVRPDGVLVGTGQDLIDASESRKELAAGAWQTGDGTYVADGYFAFSGSWGLEHAGTATTTCDDWTSTAGLGTGGIFQRTSYSWWNQYTGYCSEASNYRLYCIEE